MNLFVEDVKHGPHRTIERFAFVTLCSDYFQAALLEQVHPIGVPHEMKWGVYAMPKIDEKIIQLDNL